ncbi:diacylglycerol kinase [Candidatus Uhrbacteria bacterium CG10_big_fil_rev_8_21_14_0_10_48_16]|uniref:Diacylglycerol kinase n=1 Tax=Candidatus Uhrbacteria bacterium CG10_big_fil_rev_8_21_14_0_10_48_16 TaxID=1975038 RepID=A0A2M8LGY5_9BACT|nr:MAG: diacylglycerol kinase [Candidatus Uhrbacteria bacterium CG10_big_fil_rev_8_21_14_0_10_48_16]
MIHLGRMGKSFRHATRGVAVVFRSEQSFRIQVFISVWVLFFGYLFQVKMFEWILLVLLIGSVLTLELINSIFERIVDSFKPRIHPIVKDIKDIMAGAVLIASIISAIVGLMIFYPHLFELVSSLG